MVYSTMLWIAQITVSNIGKLANNQTCKMWTESGMTQFEVPLQQLHGGMEECQHNLSHKKHSICKNVNLGHP